VPQVVLEALRDANLGDEIQELFSEARAAYHKPKAVFLKLELDLKQARLLAKLYGDFKRKVSHSPGLLYAVVTPSFGGA
jgi:hypothetical protein